MWKTFWRSLMGLSLVLSTPLTAQSLNQTPVVSPILSEKSLPFRVQIELADFALPNGIHSGACGSYHDKWLFIAGRTNGMHGFDNNNNNFPPEEQNCVIYVIDLVHKTVAFRSLTDPQSGLTPHQVDLLSVTSPQSYQKGHTLYITGGYGVDSATGEFSTKDVLTAIDLPGLIHWVTHPSCKGTAAKHIRHLYDPIFQVTGGYMAQMGHNPTLLVFGQNFKGFYLPDTNGDYTNQVRRFYISDDGCHLSVRILPPKPEEPDPSYRRRDLNVVPIMSYEKGHLKPGLVALSGVFTLEGGIWTVPVDITRRGETSMESPYKPETFKQGMNNYISATLGLFSKKTGDMYTVLLGGISFGYFENGQFKTDKEFPFINQVTTIKRNACRQYMQYLMDATYPLILSTESNPGNALLFGAGAQFIPAPCVSIYENGVLKLDRLHKPTFVGYIIGGIQSTLPNTNTMSDSGASPYIFKVTIVPES